MKKAFLILVFSFILNNLFCQLPYFQQQADFKIDVTLNDTLNTLDGYEEIVYTNHSPDTLSFIWFHLWPNAYKNDKTAFSEQLLQLGRTDFYFSDNDKRGYINQLDFKANGMTCELEDHPQYLDVVKLILPFSLPPEDSIKITTPFHEKLPYNFSRGGYVEKTYQVTQWYPKPAVYDSKGWHEMPYLDQGEFYSEFGNYLVNITLPEAYIVASTGELQNQVELKKYKDQALAENERDSNHVAELSNLKKSNKSKTLSYVQEKVHDFAWFADKNFIIRHDTLKLKSGKVIDAWSYCTPKGNAVWNNSVQYIKDAIRTRSAWLGEYPYSVVSAVEAQMGFSGGMEYPTITSISPMSSAKSLENTIEHEVGHNWNYGILASNERDHPWMDEGMNSYLDERYATLKFGDEKKEFASIPFLQSRIPDNMDDIVYRTLLASRTDQAIENRSADFSSLNYNEMAYYKTSKWMQLLEDSLGMEVFDSCLKVYYEKWKFKHPYPQDFKKVVAEVSGRDVDPIFALLYKRGPLKPNEKKSLKVVPFISFKQTNKYNYVFLAPAAGINYFDKFMPGIVLHNYTLPEPAFHFILAPLYATGSKRLNGVGRIGYNLISSGAFRKTEISLTGETFSANEFTDSTGRKNFLAFYKISPSIKIIFRNHDLRQSVIKSLEWRTYFIRETDLLFQRDTIHQTDIISYPRTGRYLNHLRFDIENNRALYPFRTVFLGEQGKNFMRLTFDGNYFFNYPKGGGINMRFFAGKFLYLSDKTIVRKYETDRYHLNMSGAKGYEDYTYSNYFVGRNEYSGFSSQQIMIRDGAFKVRSDLLSDKIGKTDDWLIATNLTTDFPKNFNPLQVLPFKIPLKIFFDIGTYAEAWKKGAPTGKFVYDAGLQISLLHDLVNVYFPLVYSKVYDDYLKTTIGKQRFWKNISFSIDIHKISFSKIIQQAF